MNPYTCLFNAITNTVRALNTAQQQAEDLYISTQEAYLFCSHETHEVGIIRAESPEDALNKLQEIRPGAYELALIPEQDFWSFRFSCV